MKVKTYTLELQAFQVEALLPVVSASVKKMTTKLALANVTGTTDPDLGAIVFGLQDVQASLERLAKQVAKAHQKREEVVINDQD